MQVRTVVQAQMDA